MANLVVRMFSFCICLALASSSLAQPPGQSVGGADIRERALVALNAFEAWAYVYTPQEADKVHIRCEPRSADAPHACYPGTIPPCIYCIRYVPLADTADIARGWFLASERLALATLDSAVTAYPTDELFVGTLVLLLSKRGRLTEAQKVAAASRCRVVAPVCLLLRGYVDQAAGRWQAASVQFDSALSQLSERERCTLQDASAVLDVHDRALYSSLSCREHVARDALFWWLSDPSWLVPGNDRYVEHIARAVGNRILEQYGTALLDIREVRWYPGLIPQSDSVQHFLDHTSWIQHPAGQWRWRNELTRFGLPDAIAVRPGIRRNSPKAVSYSCRRIHTWGRIRWL